jgi:hypothetical protein
MAMDPMTGSSDWLSTNSFSFIQTTFNNDPGAALTLRRKYGLMAFNNKSSDKLLGSSHHHLHNNIKGDVIRFMRTQWETQMKQMDQIQPSYEEQD